jgi:cytochrome c oxidase subunit 2
MSSPIRSPEGVWWNWPVSRSEKVWLWLAGITAVILFVWMFVWMYAGDQNPTGETYRTSPERFEEKMAEYRERATATERGLRPAGEDVYVAGVQWAWDGLPVVLEAGKRYMLHLSSYDVQHGFSVRPGSELWKQINLQVLPGYEWVVPVRFEIPGTYYVVCNEFCGVNHRAMTGTFHVVGQGGSADDR